MVIKCNECGAIGETAIDGRGKRRCASCYSLDVAPVVVPVVPVVETQTPIHDAPPVASATAPIKPIKHGGKRKKQ